MFQRIVAAVDDSSMTSKVLEAAQQLARVCESVSVVVLHLEEDDVVYETIIDLEDDTSAKRLVERSVRQLSEAGITATGEVHQALQGDVAAEILQHAHRLNADLIILGPHHRSRLASLLLSVTRGVDRLTDVSVLLVH
jgi:nucleotide-binding universal stress UspA family protein